MNTIQVKVEEGTLRGEIINSCAVYKGIPYAKPPVGDLRFKAPQPLEAWSGVRDATSFSNVCPQMGSNSDFYQREFYSNLEYPMPLQDEDCLYLNIWAPEKKSTTGYPVAIWIHGGAFDHGYGSEMEFDGTAYANSEVILVTINYRVGIFGFLALEELRREDRNNSVGNYGILDQIAALKWVRKNIASFGGNPDKITVFGQSAGAISTQVLTSSPITKGMISGAIMQSGGGYNSGMKGTKTLEEAFEMGKKVQDLLGVTYARELRNLPADKFVEILPACIEYAGGMPFVPVIDNFVLEKNLDECLELGLVHDIPYMLGCNSKDLFTTPEIEGKDTPLYEGCIKFANLRNEKHGKPVYTYYFSRKLPGDDEGAFHSSELWYMFGTLDRCWRPFERRDYILSKNMLEDWTSFIKTGAPSSGWQAYSEDNTFIRRYL